MHRDTSRGTADEEITLADKAYRHLRDDIVAGLLAPGDRLRIARLSERYRIGASPLREALSLLTSEYLVVMEGQRGFSVSPTSVAELDDLSRVRCDVENDALRRAIAVGDDAWESGIVAAFHQLGKADRRRREDPGAHAAAWETSNREFHRALVAACDSPWLERLRELLYYQHERYRRISLSHPDPARDLHAEHRAIMDATLERDAERATRLSEAHIRRTTEAVRAVLERGRAA